MVRQFAEKLDLRVTTEFLQQVDAWRKRQEVRVSRSEAIRVLVERGLAIGERGER